MRESKGKRNWVNRLLTVCLIAAIAVAIFAAYRLYSYYQAYQTERAEYAAIEELAVTEFQGMGDGSLTPPISVDFDALKAINEDVVGWIYVEALPISYPIVQGKDNDQYLHTTYEGTYNFAGSIFIDYENSPNFKDPNTIVYGHNMRDGSMFGLLSRMVTQDAWQDSPYFWILTPHHNYRYTIFSAYTTEAGSETYTLFKKHNKEFASYLEKMQANSEIDIGVRTPVQSDYIATLSTCTGDSGSRFVVQGIQEE